MGAIARDDVRFEAAAEVEGALIQPLGGGHWSATIRQDPHCSVGLATTVSMFLNPQDGNAIVLVVVAASA